jgi:hypothetical protein
MQSLHHREVVDMGTRFLVMTAAAMGAVAGVLITGSSAGAQPPPGVGQSCSVEGATAHDIGGRKMWCAPPMTGDGLFWQYTPDNLPS